MSAERKNAGSGRSVNRSSKWITLEKRAAIYIRDEWRCVYCDREAHGAAFRSHKTAIYPGLNLDHVIPRSRGGTNDAGNVVTACEDCNRRKSDRTLDEWIAQPSLYESRRLRGVRERVASALAKPIDLAAGKEHVGMRATNPLPHWKRPKREPADHGAPF